MKTATDFTMALAHDGSRSTRILREGRLFVVKARHIVSDGQLPDGTTLQIGIGHKAHPPNDAIAFTVDRRESGLELRVRRLEAAIAHGLALTPFGGLRKDLLVREGEEVQTLFDRPVTCRVILSGYLVPLIS